MHHDLWRLVMSTLLKLIKEEGEVIVKDGHFVREA